MISFKEKSFSEYDAMRQLYVELMKLDAYRNRVKIIDTTALIPILRGNNVVIEKFTQTTRVFGKDRYRMYLKIGARAKLPDAVRLPQYTSDKDLGKLEIGFNTGVYIPGSGGGDDNNKKKNKDNKGGNQNPPNDSSNSGNNQQGQQGNNNQNSSNKPGNRPQQRNKSEVENRVIPFKQKQFGAPPTFSVNFKPSSFLKYSVSKLLGDAIRFDKKERSLVLEFDSIRDAIAALQILPFGLNYNLYLLQT